MLHRASMKAYADEMSSQYTVVYYAYNKRWSDVCRAVTVGYTYFDPITRIKMPAHGVLVESPNFLLRSKDYAAYREHTDKFFLAAFYRWGRKKLNIIPRETSHDKQNRKSLPADYTLYEPPVRASDYITRAARYVEQHFPNNPGHTDDFRYCHTRATARKHMMDFVKHRAKQFGDYQDAMHSDSSWLNHSLLSSSLNIGLLNPRDIIDALDTVRIPVNSYEGYVRQLFWRDYQRYCYLYADLSGNYFGNRRKLTSAWYTGDTKVLPVDTCIKRAFSTAYLNHIERLMIVGNYMMLTGIAPDEGHRWFMEFAIDSYEWVMYQNVYDMVFYASGGKTMRRPYLASANYIKKMSNYPSGKWETILSGAYHAFLSRHKKQLARTIYARS